MYIYFFMNILKSVFILKFISKCLLFIFEFIESMTDEDTECKN